jgi:hypothetical protein
MQMLWQDHNSVNSEGMITLGSCHGISQRDDLLRQCA